VRVAGRWLVENFLHRVLLRRYFSGGQTTHLKYRDVATAPYEVLQDTAEWLGLPEEKSGSGEKMIRQYVNHAVSGNEMRWKDTRVKCDNRWVSELEKLYKNICWVITYPLAHNIGYER
jgi:hypothetical protein